MSTEHPLTLWLTSRSATYTGLGRCQRQRYLTNHFGPTGYGIVRKAESLPLATGKYTHLAFEGLVGYLQEFDAFPTVDVIRGAVHEACAQYDTVIAERGYAGLLKSERSEAVVVEQKALLTGLVWAACRTILPWLHREFRVLQCELDSIYVLDCTCELGSGVLDAQAHSAKGCLGIGQMLKQDMILEHRTRKTLAYMEIKTTGWAGDSWAPQWETKPQLPIGTFGIPERYGQAVTETYILGLYKGRRAKVTEPDGSEYYRQESPLCIGYRRPGNPPLAPDDWLPTYEWTDPTSGEVKRASRAHKKAGIWELAESDWPTWLASKANDPSLTSAEFWAAWLPQTVAEKQVFLVGPMQVQEAQVASLKDQIVGEERRWQETLWKLYEVQQAHPWESPEFQQALDRLVPASWECRRYGVNSQCEFVPICFRADGWQDPLATGKFVPRRPHHQAELDVAIARGLLPEVAEEVTEGDEE